MTSGTVTVAGFVDPAGGGGGGGPVAALPADTYTLTFDPPGTRVPPCGLCATDGPARLSRRHRESLRLESRGLERCDRRAPLLADNRRDGARPARDPEHDRRAPGDLRSGRRTLAEHGSSGLVREHTRVPHRQSARPHRGSRLRDALPHNRRHRHRGGRGHGKRDDGPADDPGPGLRRLGEDAPGRNIPARPSHDPGHETAPIDARRRFEPRLPDDVGDGDRTSRRARGTAMTAVVPGKQPPRDQAAGDEHQQEQEPRPEERRARSRRRRRRRRGDLLFDGGPALHDGLGLDRTARGAATERRCESHRGPISVRRYLQPRAQTQTCCSRNPSNSCTGS